MVARFDVAEDYSGAGKLVKDLRHLVCELDKPCLNVLDIHNVVIVQIKKSGKVGKVNMARKVISAVASADADLNSRLGNLPSRVCYSTKQKGLTLHM